MTPADLKHLRLTLGRTQEGMAQIVGTSLASWRRWERGDTTPLPIFRERIAKMLAYANGTLTRGEE